MMDTLVVYGLGLIGGSFALGLKQRFFKRVVGFEINQDHANQALALGIVDEIGSNLADVDGVDMLLLAVPVQAYRPLLASIKPVLETLGRQYILSDVGSVKAPLVEAAQAVFGELPTNWVLGHPIAGSEKHGPEAATASLFQRHKVILTPNANTDALVLNSVAQMWRALGADVETMSVEHHDQVLAQTSHLPHFLAYALVSDMDRQSDSRQIFHYAAGGFRDFTRIAASSPTMWHDIFFSNRHAVLKALAAYTDELKRYKTYLETGDSAGLVAKLTQAQAARQYFQSRLERGRLSQVSTHQQITLISKAGVAVNAKTGLVGELSIPGDKSISHRAIMFGALAEGVTQIEGFLEGEDSLATLQAFRDMGVEIQGPEGGKVRIKGVGMKGLQAPKDPLYLGNSGTAMRLLAGLLAGQNFGSILEGDASLSKRPMRRVTDPLRAMGAEVSAQAKGTPPLKIMPTAKLSGISYSLPMASAQVKSAILLAGLFAEGETRITEPAPTRDHTERMLRSMGYEVQQEGNQVWLRGGGKLSAISLEVPGDISSAAFFMVAAAISPGSNLCLRNIGINPTRDGIITILQLMGANIRVENRRQMGDEPIADVYIQYSELKGIDIPEALVPLAIDEFPIIFIAAACALGATRLTGAEELRVKESDRIQAMVDGLQALGVPAEGTEDGAIIPGLTYSDKKQSSVHDKPSAQILYPFLGGEVDSLGDHRIAMAFAVAALRSQADIRILDCANVATSFPNFLSLANGIGIQVDSEIIQ
jgi:3-phosphoshikimate 1-carboxyvinyltransferase